MRWERDLREPQIAEWRGLLLFLGYYPFEGQTMAGLVLNARRFQGWEQKALASKLGVIHQQLRRWEHGREAVSLEVVSQLKALATF